MDGWVNENDTELLLEIDGGFVTVNEAEERGDSRFITSLMNESTSKSREGISDGGDVDEPEEEGEEVGEEGFGGAADTERVLVLFI
jgi:hypothetical protein